MPRSCAWLPVAERTGAHLALPPQQVRVARMEEVPLQEPCDPSLRAAQGSHARAGVGIAATAGKRHGRCSWHARRAEIAEGGPRRPRKCPRNLKVRQ